MKVRLGGSSARRAWVGKRERVGEGGAGERDRSRRGGGSPVGGGRGRGPRPERLWIFFLVFSLFGSACHRPLEEGEPAVPFELEGLDGRTVSLQGLRGKVVALHFWATWCPPCLEELPRLVKLFRGKDPERFVLLPVSVDRAEPSYIRDFLSSWGLPADAYLDPGGGLAKRYGTIRYPETYIIGPDGVLRKKVIGAGDWSAPFWERFLQQVYSQGNGNGDAPGSEPGRTDARGSSFSSDFPMG